MQDILADVEPWRQENEQIAIATVIDTWGSSPRPVGAKLALTASGRLGGSVSAGCVEGAVIEEGQDVIAGGRPRLLHYGVADETSWEVGLACGGNIEVWVEPFTAFAGVYEQMKTALAARTPLALVTVLQGPELWLGQKLLVTEDGRTVGALEMKGVRETAVAAAHSALAAGQGGRVEPAADLALFVDVMLPPPRLVIVGAVHIAIHLVTMANAAGFDTYVVDPRRGFATAARFAHATALIREWPQRALPELGLDPYTYVVLLTHDPKLDDPALQAVLPETVGYVGALGSRRTHAKRRERLLAAGVPAAQLDRLHAPVGLDLGGRSPGEIAVSILAEIVQVRNVG